MMELRDQRRVIEGRDQVLNDAETENARLKADTERVEHEEIRARLEQALADRLVKLQILCPSEHGPEGRGRSEPGSATPRAGVSSCSVPTALS